MINPRLEKEPYLFEFFQAVRLLEKNAQQKLETTALETAPGSKAKYDDEVVFFKNNPKLTFNASDIQNLKIVRDSHSPKNQQYWEMTVSVLGLLGSQGVMPRYFSERVLLELRKKNTDLVDFVNFIEHRSISLFYQAWRKYRLPLNYEKALASRSSRRAQWDLFTHSLLALMGIGTEGLMYRQAFSDETLVGCASFLARPTVSAEAIVKIVKHQFGFDADVKQFVCQWEELPKDLLTRLPGPEVPEGQNNVLGQNAMLGQYGYNTQGKFIVVIDGDKNPNYEQLAPGSRVLSELQSMMKFVCGDEFEFAIEITLPSNAHFETQLSLDTEPLLGWNTRLRSQDYVVNERESIVLSQDIYPMVESLELID